MAKKIAIISAGLFVIALLLVFSAIALTVNYSSFGVDYLKAQKLSLNLMLVFTFLVVTSFPAFIFSVAASIGDPKAS